MNWRHRLPGLAAALVFSSVAAFVFVDRPPASPANATTARLATHVAARVASELRAATAPYDPLALVQVRQGAPSAHAAHATLFECVLGPRAVPVLETISWVGSMTDTVSANVKVARASGCHSYPLTLPFPPHDDLVAPRVSVVDIPIRPDSQLGVPITATG